MDTRERTEEELKSWRGGERSHLYRCIAGINKHVYRSPEKERILSIKAYVKTCTRPASLSLSLSGALMRWREKWQTTEGGRRWLFLTIQLTRRRQTTNRYAKMKIKRVTVNQEALTLTPVWKRERETYIQITRA